jgi:hypothetical protein
MNEQSCQTGAQHAIFVNMGFMTVIPLELLSSPKEFMKTYHGLSLIINNKRNRSPYILA